MLAITSALVRLVLEVVCKLLYGDGGEDCLEHLEVTCVDGVWRDHEAFREGLIKSGGSVPFPG